MTPISNVPNCSSGDRLALNACGRHREARRHAKAGDQTGGRDPATTLLFDADGAVAVSTVPSERRYSRMQGSRPLRLGSSASASSRDMAITLNTFFSQRPQKADLVVANHVVPRLVTWARHAGAAAETAASGSNACERERDRSRAHPDRWWPFRAVAFARAGPCLLLERHDNDCAAPLPHPDTACVIYG